MVSLSKTNKAATSQIQNVEKPFWETICVIGVEFENKIFTDTKVGKLAPLTALFFTSMHTLR